MKLHLPKSLRAALLACLTLFTPAASTLTTGTLIASGITYTMLSSQALAETYTVTGDTTGTGGTLLFDTATADDTVIMQFDTDNGTKFWWDTAPSDYTCDAGIIQINSWQVTDGSTTKSWTFNSTIIGGGNIEFIPWSTTSGASNDNLYTFTGDMSAWTGNIIAVANTSGAYGLSVAVTGTTSSAASGTGSITIEGSAEYLSYSFTGATTIANSSIAVSNLYLYSGGSYTVTGNLTVSGTTTIDDSTTLVLASGTSSSLNTISVGTSSSISVIGTLTLTGSYTITSEPAAAQVTSPLRMSALPMVAATASPP